MPKFHEYTVLSKQITASDELKARVLRAARASKRQVVEFPKDTPADKKQTGKYRSFRFFQKAAVAAILVLCIPITAFAAARHFGLLEHFGKFGMENADEIQELVETFPGEAVTSPAFMENGEIKVPEFRITEAICDEHSLYLAAEIKPVDERYLLVPSELDLTMDVKNMQIPGVSGMSIESYADSLGKEILLVGTSFKNNNGLVSSGLMSECTADGTVYQYFTCENPSDLKEFPLTVTCLYHTLDMPLAERFEFEIQVSNKSKDKTVTTFTQFENPGMGITVHSLTLEETEVGLYAEFRFSFTEGAGFGFDLCAADGARLPNLPGSGTFLFEDNGDGTYTSKTQYQKVDALDGLTFRVIRAGDYETFGPFEIIG